jgi:hypothetical protein
MNVVVSSRSLLVKTRVKERGHPRGPRMTKSFAVPRMTKSFAVPRSNES